MHASLLILLVTSITTIQSQFLNSNNQHNQRILLSNVRKIILNKGSSTNARRSSAISQLNCVGGSAKCDYRHLPTVVTCTNIGLNSGQDFEWHCEARFDSGYKFGKFEVSCEGYDYPDDPYILKDSCGLEYELEFDYSDASRHSNDANPSTSNDVPYFMKIILFVIIGVLIFAIYKNRQDTQQQQPDPETNPDDSSSRTSTDTNNRTETTGNANYRTGPINRDGWNLGNIGFSLIGSLIGNFIWSIASSIFSPRIRAYNPGYNRWGSWGKGARRTWGSDYRGTTSYPRTSSFKSSGGSSFKSGFGGTKRR